MMFLIWLNLFMAGWILYFLELYPISMGIFFIAVVVSLVQLGISIDNFRRN